MTLILPATKSEAIPPKHIGGDTFLVETDASHRIKFQVLAAIISSFGSY